MSNKLYKCLHCGRIFKDEIVPHKCNSVLRERHIEQKELKVLHLVLIGKWYEMIASGEKKEEYREASDYWNIRLCGYKITGFCAFCNAPDCNFPPNKPSKRYDTVCFHRGYTNITMLFELESIKFGHGKPEWGAPEYEVFILKLGKRLK